MNQARRQAEIEQNEYEELNKWLDQAHDVLQIVDRPVTDRQAEYKVRSIITFHRNLSGTRSVTNNNDPYIDT